MFTKLVISLISSFLILWGALAFMGITPGYLWRAIGLDAKDHYSAIWKEYYDKNGDSGLLTYMPDTYVESYRPGLFPLQKTKVNSLGFLDKEPDLSLSRCNVLVLGDSYVAAHQVEIDKKFIVLLGEMLKARDPRIQVIGMGMDGTSIVHQTEFYKKFRNSFSRNPDFVLVPLISNDLRDSYYWNDIVSFGQFYADSNGNPIAGLRTTVFDFSDGMRVVHPRKGQSSLINFKEKSAVKTSGDWNRDYKSYIVAAIKMGMIPKSSVGNFYLAENFPDDMASEGIFGMKGNLDPFWQKFVNAYDFSVGEFVRNTRKDAMDSPQIGVFTTHSMEFYNRFPHENFSYELLNSRFFQPWISRDIPVKRLVNFDPNSTADDFHIKGDGHLSSEGHKRISEILLKMYGDQIVSVCKKNHK